MRGVNSVAVSGNIGSRIHYGVTEDGVPAVSFDLMCEERQTKTWVRVNAYGGLVSVCQTEIGGRNRLHDGGYVQVVGRIMNRKRRTEVRAEEIVFGGDPSTGF